ncbi:MAG TPA: PQQ-binding-like beta-propeller repeat protein [Planctomycetota bacterium]|nr:PQQ-binding-like beta-propeller repeat protein [Planctomycetota bacterium]
MTKTHPLGKAAFLLSLLALPLLGAGPAPDSDWSQWRGPKRDGISPDTGLLKEWPAGGPALAWKTTGIGTGYATVTVLGDRLYTLGDSGDSSNLVAINLADGKVLWTAPVGKPHTEGNKEWLGPRASPATDGKLVIALGALGELVCVDLAGREKWRKNLHADFDGQVGGWKYSESPLLDGENVVVTPGGPKGSVLALKKETGEPVWRSSEIKDRAEYPSLMPVEIGGQPQYLLLTMQSVAGIAAASGKLLWRIDRPGKTAIIPTPIYKDGLVFVTSGYGVGCNLIKVTADGGTFKAEEVYSDEKAGVKTPERTANHHGGMILVGDHLYGTNEKMLRCVEMKTAKVVWENKCVGKGSIAYADGHLVVRSESKNGEIALVEASPAGYKESGRFKQPAFSGMPQWPHPVIIGGRLYIRDEDTLYAYDVKAK